MISSIVTISSPVTTGVAARCAAVAALLFAWSFLAPDTSAAEQRVALVIANGQYKFTSALPDARRGAEEVADALRHDGFQTVTLRTDLTRDAMVRAPKEFHDAADNADWAMIYYSGHIIEVDQVNYLVPVDAELRDARDVKWETLAYDDVLATVSGARALRVLVLNTCRMRIPRANTTRGIRLLRAPLPDPDPDRAAAADVIPARLGPVPDLQQGTIVAYSAAVGQACDDNNPYADVLARNLKVPGLELYHLFARVRDEVREATGGRQEPFIYASLPGTADFYFVPAK